MSFDIFLGVYRDGANATLDRGVVEKCFGPFITRKEPQCWILEFPEGGRSEMYHSGDAALEGFMIARPPGHSLFWSALFDVMILGRGTVYWPGSRPLVADAAYGSELPEDMVKSLGDPVVVRNGAAILDEMRRT